MREQLNSNFPWKTAIRAASRGRRRGFGRRRRRLTPQSIIITLIILAAIWAYDNFNSDDQQPQDQQPAAVQPQQGGSFD